MHQPQEWQIPPGERRQRAVSRLDKSKGLRCLQEHRAGRGRRCVSARCNLGCRRPVVRGYRQSAISRPSGCRQIADSRLAREASTLQFSTPASSAPSHRLATNLLSPSHAQRELKRELKHFQTDCEAASTRLCQLPVNAAAVVRFDAQADCGRHSPACGRRRRDGFSPS